MEGKYRSQTTGNVIDESKSMLNVSNIVLKFSKFILTLSWILFPILYFIFYYRSDIPDFFHIIEKAGNNPEILNKCYNVSVISYNLKEIYNRIIDFINSIPLY